jgi:hypothetical protein
MQTGSLDCELHSGNPNYFRRSFRQLFALGGDVIRIGMDQASEPRCWLCGAVEALTSEHVPPRSAFNAQGVTLQRVSQAGLAAGYLEWEAGTEFRDGHSFRSLCTKCNHRGGKSFVPAYRDFAVQVAQKVSTRIPLKSVEIEKVRNPQLIFRQILMQFVSANGPSFVGANPWIREFLMTRKLRRLPEDVNLYIFATQTRGMRTTGIGGQILLEKATYRVISEFTHWPLGTILSYTELNDEPLLRITDWGEIPFNSKKAFNLRIPVNPAITGSPLDFRDDLDIAIDMNKPPIPRMDDALASVIVSAMETEIKRRSGNEMDAPILVGRVH